MNISLEYNNVLQDLTFTKVVELSNNVTKLNIISTNRLGFYIVQVHTYEHPIILSETSSIKKRKSISGTNIGLYIKADKRKNFKTVFIFTTQNCTALISISAYKEDGIHSIIFLHHIAIF